MRHFSISTPVGTRPTGRAKLLLRIVGVAIAAFGLVCLPVGYSINPKRDLSAFNNLADTGIFVTVGFVLIATGVVLFVASWILPGEEPEDVL
jgi:hypothetical protein